MQTEKNADKKVSLLSRAAEIVVSGYGLFRYHNKRLVRALLSGLNIGNQGGTAKIFVPEVV